MKLYLNCTVFLLIIMLYSCVTTGGFHNDPPAPGHHWRPRKVTNVQPGSVPQAPFHSSHAPPSHAPSVSSAKNPVEDNVFMLRSPQHEIESRHILATSSAQNQLSTEDKTTAPTTKEEDSFQNNNTSPFPTTDLPDLSSESSPPNTTTSSPPTTSSSTNSEVTSTTTTSTTTTSTSSTTEKPEQSLLDGVGVSTKTYFCLCDLQVNTCDMNCCCDPDCNPEEKALFTGCTGSVIYDPKSTTRNKEHSCYKSFVIYKENTPYKIERNEKGLFCVIKENTKQVREFSRNDMERISRKIQNGKFKLRPKYGWEQDATADHFKLEEKPYKYGSVIWTVKSTEDSYQEAMLRFPAPFFTPTCSIQEPVKFLQDYISTCIFPLSNLKSQCKTTPQLNVNHFIKNYTIISNPKKTEENSSDFPTLDIIPALACHNNMDQCLSFMDPSGDTNTDVSDFEFPRPELDLENSLCQNVLFRLNLTFVHRGLEGVNYVLAKALLVDVPLSVKHVKQEFYVDFIWNSEAASHLNDTNSTSLVSPNISLDLKKLPRSGNPGYIIGKPVILGKKVAVRKYAENNSKEFTTVDKVQLLHDSNLHWLHIQGAGDCPMEGMASEIQGVSRNPVQFGYEHVSTCRLKLESFRYCEQIQRHIASVVFGTDDPLQFTKTPFYVAAYGSPDAFPSDWVPLQFVDITQFLGAPSGIASNLLSNGCDAIIMGIHITITYALVGPVDAPQAKITGVFYEPEEAAPIPAESTFPQQCSNEHQLPCIRDLSVTTTVSFVDVSGKPTSRVATWPVVSIRLPSDFFYPFSSSSPLPPSSAASTMLLNSRAYSGVIMVVAVAMSFVYL